MKKEKSLLCLTRTVEELVENETISDDFEENGTREINVTDNIHEIDINTVVDVEDNGLGDFDTTHSVVNDYCATAETMVNVDKLESEDTDTDVKSELATITEKPTADINEGLESNVSTAVTDLEEKVVPSVIELHATAYFENSPYDRLTEEDFQSLGKFATNSDHLRQNVRNVAIDSQSSFRENEGILTHTAKLRMYVLTERLWEAPRSYIWKHLGGENYWEKGNGTKVTLRRIHQKD